MNNQVFEALFKQSKFNAKEKEQFLKELEGQLKLDNHDIALEEKMQAIAVCFDKSINSIFT